MTLAVILATEPRCGCPATARLWFQSLTHRRAVVGMIVDARAWQLAIRLRRDCESLLLAKVLPQSVPWWRRTTNYPGPGA